MKIKLSAGDIIPATNMTQLTQKLFNSKTPYRSLYFSPNSLQKYISGGFYLWIDKFTETAHTHDLKNGLSWNITIDKNKSKIERKFVGDRKFLTDELMDKHGKKILVFNIRNDFSGSDFLGVFLEEDTLLYENQFIGMTYTKIKDTIEYEITEKKKTKTPSINQLKNSKEFLESVLKKFNEGSKEYEILKENLDEINEQIKNLT